MAQWKHKKRGTMYEIITDVASIQCATDASIEEKYGDDNWAVYRNIHTGAIYVRMTDEFLDGRFEKIGEDE